MSAYLVGLWGAVVALLPLLLGITVLVMVGLVLDAKRGEW